MPSIDEFFGDVAVGDTVVLSVPNGQYIGVCTNLGKRSATLEAYDAVTGVSVKTKLDLRTGRLGRVRASEYHLLEVRSQERVHEPLPVSNGYAGPMCGSFGFDREEYERETRARHREEQRRERELDDYGRSSVFGSDE